MAGCDHVVSMVTKTVISEAVQPDIIQINAIVIAFVCLLNSNNAKQSDCYTHPTTKQGRSKIEIKLLSSLRTVHYHAICIKSMQY